MKPIAAVLTLLAPAAMATPLPYTFEAGQAAKANEVNANFSILAQAQAGTDEQLSMVSAEVSDLQSALATLQEQVDALLPDFESRFCTSVETGSELVFSGVPFVSSAFTLMDADGTTRRLNLMVPKAPMVTPQYQAALTGSDVAGYSKAFYFCDQPARLENVLKVDYDLSDINEVAAYFYTETRLTVRHPAHDSEWFSNATRLELGKVALPRDGSGDYQLAPQDLPSVEAIKASLLGGYQVYFHSSLR
ncbi:hypothetical protein Fbal_0204 [Ferrimonas balearica DSM 9799]|uniref:Uncharacterized protein n=1 Tax=Ferrimonas balearica (strain DSM 9799 / CCM 4581 / KCTC 23876 / PAT) TaxID=550540 RepID=E1SL24_FERBD|nr:hypothetical protein [Ferrimonas balearica]ADN74418.1 hypothetical protein Fbal_0204 [Ferrimonas balearica DSM 9799]